MVLHLKFECESSELNCSSCLTHDFICYVTVIALSVLPFILYCAGYFCMDENDCKLSVMKGYESQSNFTASCS